MSTEQHGKITEQSGHLFDYAQLRSWYLARLRQSIIKQIESGQLTPSALIAADRKAVEKLVLTALQPKSQYDSGTLKHGLSLLQFKWLLIGIPVTLQISVALWLIFSGLTHSQPSMIAWASVLVVICSSVLLFILFNNAVSQRLQALHARLMNICGSRRPDKNGDDIANLEGSLLLLSSSLSEAIERERAIADYALEFICALDASGMLIAFSPSFAEFCGYAAYELINRQFTRLVISEDIERTVTFLNAMCTTKSTVPFENRLKRKDGTIVDIHWLTEWSETEQMLFCTGRDISDQKRLERVRKEFVSMVGHDLKTPLTSLGCTLDLISSNTYGELSQKGQSLLANANDSISHLLSLINQLLDLEKMEAGKLPMRKELTPISSVLKGSVDAVFSFANKQGVEIIADPTEAVAMIDRERLTQVLVNLLSNAIKFSPGGSKISIDVSQDKQNVIVKVSDQGPGIPAKFHDIIFDRFQQVYSEDDKHGSGLGLSICKAIIDAHDGSIGVDSDVGNGSTFWFKLPL